MEEFEFKSTLAKINRISTNKNVQPGVPYDAPYDLFSDREELSSVMQEVGKKGLIPAEFQLVVLNFVLFWYFFRLGPQDNYDQDDRSY